MFRLNGKVAIVTGAAAGIGQAIAEAFSRQGCVVVPTDRPGVSLDQTVEMCQNAGAEDIYVRELDVTDQESISKAVKNIFEQFGHLDILANNAGINRPMPAEEVTEEIWDQVMDINLKGSFFVTKEVVPFMKQQKYGRIIFTSSQAGIVARDHQPPYCASKGGIISMTRALAFDWAKYGITVNSVAPCFALTALTKSRIEDPVYGKMILDMIPVGRCVNPPEVGAAFCYLASDEAAMVTGQTLVIDGGWTMW